MGAERGGHCLDRVGGLAMINDRTQNDVDEAIRLNRIGWDNMTENERLQWLSGLKGSYNPSDMNRIEMAVQIIADLLNKYEYKVDISTFLHWGKKSIPNRTDLKRYLDNVSRLIKAFYIKPTTPELPSDMNKFTFEEANAIEQILIDIYVLFKNMTTSFIYCGEIWCGEEVAVLDFKLIDDWFIFCGEIFSGEMEEW